MKIKVEIILKVDPEELGGIDGDVKADLMDQLETLLDDIVGVEEVVLIAIK